MPDWNNSTSVGYWTHFYPRWINPWSLGDLVTLSLAHYQQVNILTIPISISQQNSTTICKNSESGDRVNKTGLFCPFFFRFRLYKIYIYRQNCGTDCCEIQCTHSRSWGDDMYTLWRSLWRHGIYASALVKSKYVSGLTPPEGCNILMMRQLLMKSVWHGKYLTLSNTNERVMLFTFFF